MAFGGFDQQNSGQPVSDINVTPLVDVMLVLLVIFIVTAPLFTHAVRVDLPNADAQPVKEKPETVQLAIDKEGRIHWNRDVVTPDDLRARLAQASTQQPQPEVHLHADQNARYKEVAEVMAAAQKAGLKKIGFITNPRPDR